MLKRIIPFAFLFVAICGSAELSPNEIAAANPLFDSSVADSLNCDFHNNDPWMGYDLQFHFTYWMTCPRDQFQANDKVSTYIRIKRLSDVSAAANQPVVMKDGPIDVRVQHFSGILPAGAVDKFSAMSDIPLGGPGACSIEFLMVSQSGHRFSKKWDAQIQLPKLEPSEPTINWDGKLFPDGVPVTVLLNITPVLSGDSLVFGGDQKRYPVDVLNAVLTKIRPKTINIYAFNLQQKNEILHRDNADLDCLIQLANLLLSLHSQARDVMSAPNPQISTDFLLKYFKQTAAEPGIVVVASSTTLPFIQKISKQEVAANVGRPTAKIFSLEYYGLKKKHDDLDDYPTPDELEGRDNPSNYKNYRPPNEPSDANLAGGDDLIARTTFYLDGKVFRIRTAKDLDNAAKKIVSNIHR